MDANVNFILIFGSVIIIEFLIQTKNMKDQNETSIRDQNGI